MFNISSADVRRFFAQVWQQRFNPDLDAMQKRALAIILAHPEYHHYLENVDQYLDYNWQPEGGQINPFLHLSLHLSLQEQIAIDQPFGIRAIFETLSQREGDAWRAEHLMMDALVEMIWQAQRTGQGFDVNDYITQLRRQLGMGAEEQPRKNPHEI